MATKMKYAIVLFKIAFAIFSAFSQSDYKILHERVSVEFYNKSFFQDLKLTLFHYSRHEKRYNGSGVVLQELTGRRVTNIVQAYKFQSNEYRQFPVYYSGNACLLSEQNLFGTYPVSFDTNITICPTRKGYLYLANAYLDDSKLPPNAPRGRYMLEFKILYNTSILLGIVNWYIEIVPTNQLEKVIGVGK